MDEGNQHMTERNARSRLASRLEGLAARLAALACIIVSIAAWRSIATYQEMWPLPGLYFVELPLVTVAVAWAFAAHSRLRNLLAWVGLGIVTAFSILGAFSIGMAYAPVALLLGIIAISSDLREGQPLAIHAGASLIAAMVQTAGMLLAIRLLYPSALFHDVPAWSGAIGVIIRAIASAAILVDGRSI
jgi:hypothetical protein